MLECHFSWPSQNLVTLWEIPGARNAVFFYTKCVRVAQKATSANGLRMRISRAVHGRTKSQILD